MNTHVVTKRLQAGKETLEPGTEVDASAWHNAVKLEEQRYLKPLTGQEKEGEKQARRGK